MTVILVTGGRNNAQYAKKWFGTGHDGEGVMKAHMVTECAIWQVHMSRKI